MIKEFILELFKFVGELNYWHVALLSALESTCFPVVIPVETIIIPMGYYAFLGTKKLSLLMVSCTAGIVIGCLINYWFARALGRTFIYKHAKFLHINIEKLQRLENKFLSHGRLLMFVGRFIPIPSFKHIITIPAGMAKMRITPFIFYNALGGFIFSTSMLLIGYFFGSSEELVHKAIGKFTVACVVLLLTYFVIKIIIKIIKYNRKKKIELLKDENLELIQNDFYTNKRNFVKKNISKIYNKFKNRKHFKIKSHQKQNHFKFTKILKFRRRKKY